MKVQVSLADVVEGIESQSFDNRVFIHRTSGEIIYMLGEFLTKAENEKPYDHMNEWQQEMMELAYDMIENEDQYLALPEYEIDEYRMMEKFCYTVTDSKKENALLDAIQGRGAFRRFKDLIYTLGLAEDWYDYRDEAYKQIARRFCEKHHFSYKE